MIYFNTIKALFHSCNYKLLKKIEVFIKQSGFINIISVVIITLPFSTVSQARDLILSLPMLPNMAENKDGKSTGVLIGLYKEMANYYRDGKIVLLNDTAYPFQRSISNVITGKADFQFPVVRSQFINQHKLPFEYVPEEIGKIAFILFTNVNKKKLNLENLNQYKIEVLRGHAQYFNFKVLESNSLEQSLRKILLGRIDGLIHAQEGTDHVIKANKFKDIRRQLFMEFDSCCIVAKNKNSAVLKKIISDLLINMKKDKSLYKYVGKGRNFLAPYNNWQPSEMGW